MEDALCPFRIIQLRIENIEECINKKLDEIFIPDFAKLIEEVRWLQEDINKIIQ